MLDRDKDAIATVIAAMMSRGCGIGDSTMQHLVRRCTAYALRSEHILRRINEFRNELIRYSIEYKRHADSSC